MNSKTSTKRGFSSHLMPVSLLPLARVAHLIEYRGDAVYAGDSF